MISKKWLLALGVGMVLALGAAACGDDDDDGGEASASGLSGTIRIDGSSTVAPLTSIAAEEFQGENPDVNVTVGTSGTSGGFEKFCAGETDANDASRQIEPEEKRVCSENGVEYGEVQVANDALSVIVNPNNPLTCISVETLNQAWDNGSTVDSWGDLDGLDADVGDEDLELFGPGSDSGTYDYFTEAVNGEEGVIRTDYNSIGENDNAAINGVAGDEWAMAYVPYSFVEEAGEQVKALEIDGGDGCVAPTAETVQDGSYTPLGRPLFIYPSAEALAKPEFDAFLEFYIANQASLTEAATFVPMTEEQTQASEEEISKLIG
ncbi:MAG: phosphate binding protein [Solirubrobacterales bacterium]|nr:phosphate binding protein [Solirubrobacterales bacterium]